MASSYQCPNNLKHDLLAMRLVQAGQPALSLQVRSLYGVPKDLLGLLEGRQTYVIDKEGTVKLCFNSQFSPEKHPQEALAALNSK